MRHRYARIALAATLSVALITAIAVVARTASQRDRVHVTAYFANSNGIFAGDEIRILGVAVGKIDTIEPQPTRAKISFWYDSAYRVPAGAIAAVLSPSLVTSRAIQLTPAYTSGPMLADGAVIGEDRTAVPVEWDDFRSQLQRLADTLRPDQPGGVSTLGSFINTAADNLRGQGGDIRKTLIELSQAISVLGDHSKDIFGTVRNLAILESALHDSTDLMRQLNQNLATVTGLLSNGTDEVGNAVRDINTAAGAVDHFIGANKDAIGTTSDKLASLSQALNDSKGDLEQTLHLAPNTFQNFLNIYEPAHASLVGSFAINNFANPISFLCGAIQAASRLGAEQSAKLCVQYLAPIIKNRQFNFPPLGENLFVGAAARPNEVTYSEDWMRPDYVPPPTGPGPGRGETEPGPLAAEAPAGAPGPDPAVVSPEQSTNPAQGLEGMMTPPGGGS